MRTYLEAFLDKKMLQNYKYISNDIVYGKAGLSIYYAIMGRMNKDKKKMYKKCINDVLTKISDKTPISLEKGLLGVCLSIDYILSKFKKGNSDYVLSDLDSKIYREISLGIANSYMNFTQFVEMLFYVSTHLKLGVKNKTKRVVFEKASIELVENIYSCLPIDFFNEPIPFNINHPPLLFLDSLIRLHSLSIYKERIVHILNELGYNVLSSIPSLHANRLALFYIVKKACICLPELPNQWHECASILSQNISLDKILNEEIRNRQIFFLDGLSGVYLLMLSCNKLFGYNYYKVDKNLFYRRIMDSDTTKSLKKEILLNGFGLNGYWGIHLLYEYMKKLEG
jgi:hypothetical protein